MVNFVLWILFGALAGWIASIIMRTNQQQGAIANVIVGLIGALVGGFIVRALGGAGISGFNLTSLVVAVVGAVLLLFGYNTLARR